MLYIMVFALKCNNDKTRNITRYIYILSVTQYIIGNGGEK